MNRGVAIVLSLLILSLLASCGDIGSPPRSEPDIEATVEARVAEELAESVPTPTSIVKRGQGIDWRKVQTVFTRPDMGGFRLEYAELSDGTPRLLGWSQDRLATLILRGPADSVSLLVFFSGNAYLDSKNGLYLLTLLDVTVPEWNGREKWLIDSLNFSVGGDWEDTKTYNGKLIRYKYFEGEGVINLSVESKQ